MEHTLNSTGLRLFIPVSSFVRCPPSGGKTELQYADNDSTLKRKDNSYQTDPRSVEACHRSASSFRNIDATYKCWNKRTTSLKLGVIATTTTKKAKEKESRRAIRVPWLAALTQSPAV
ncbi:hypothetical protein MHYP_G00097080 [Metynnis hypsauchen]